MERRRENENGDEGREVRRLKKEERRKEDRT